MRQVSHAAALLTPRQHNHTPAQVAPGDGTAKLAVPHRGTGADMHLIKRAVLVSEMKLAHDEAARLSEMITLLETGRVLDESRLRQLRTERLVINKRALRLHDALRQMDADGQGSAVA